MGIGFDRKPGGASLVQHTFDGSVQTPAPGKRTLTEQLIPATQTSDAAGTLQGDPRAVSAHHSMAQLAPRFGHSFDEVNVHTGQDGDARAQAHGAKAVAEGRDIYLSSAVDPGSTDGRRVMAHEMAHVVQQTGSPTQARAYSHGGNAFEREANQVGETVAAGGSASPVLRTGHTVAQGYESPEHQSMGNDVHSVLDPVANDPNAQECQVPKLGGLSPSQIDEQTGYEALGQGASQSPGLGSVADVNPNARVAVPRLAEMLQKDPFVNERSRSLTISLRNFKMQQDMAGPFLAIETDPVTKQVARYDVPVSPGDMTALNGDLYGSVENMRKAPVAELVALQGILDQEADWERRVAAGNADPKKAPNFDAQWDGATSWRAHPVYAAGDDLGPEGAATGGDTAGYVGLALNNRAHFGEDTNAKTTLEVQVRAGNIDSLAQGPQGNFADGNEQAWMDGHARALVLAREAFALKNTGPATPQSTAAAADTYGHESDVPPTGLVNPAAGATALEPLPLDANHQPLRRSSGVATFDSKRNDAYVENAGADHYLTDAFAAGHQIVREVIGQVTDQFVKDKGGREAFLEFVVKNIQKGAVADPEKATGELGDFQSASRTWKATAARGDSWLNSFTDGLKQKLKQKIDDTKLHAIGAKLVHDYYNKRGLIVHNKKGMTFEIKGDGTADTAPQARQIIAMTVLESRNQIAEMANTGNAGNPMDVWDYTPDLDKTAFTQTSGPKAMDIMFSDSDYLWHMIKDNFSVAQTTSTDAEQHVSASDPVQQRIRGPGGDGASPRAPADVGAAPLRVWLQRRHDYVTEQVGKTQPRQEYGSPPVTIDGVTLPPGNGE